MKLVKQNDDSIPVMEMNDGQLAVIVQWGNESSYNGIIVQRWRDHLIIIGESDCWSNIYKPGCGLSEDCRVRILQPGELLEV